MTDQKKNMKKNKLAIIVPYRNRESHLLTFTNYMKDFLKDLSYQIFVIEQLDDKPFNRGKLLNIGAKFAIENNFDYLCFHDVDMLPIDVDYSYPEFPTSLISELENKENNIFYNYFGGITIFNVKDFILVNGYSNHYWGWGYEDTDLFYRVTNTGLYHETFKIGTDDTSNVHLDLREYDYVKVPINSEMIDGDFDIEITVKIETKYFNENDAYDEYPILSIPGYNIGIFYNSFNRYFLQAYDENKKPYSITTDILDDLVATFKFSKKSNIISFLMNDNIVGEIELETPILNLGNKYLYIGSFSEYNNIEFDLKLIKLSINNSIVQQNEMIIDGGIIVNKEMAHKISLPKPARRNGLFRELTHETNASINKSWVHQETRKNQIFYNNFVKQNLIDCTKEGLNTLEFKLVKEENHINYKLISVEL